MVQIEEAYKRKCPKCGSTNLKRHKETDNKYVFCVDCETETPLPEFIRLDRREYECDKCEAPVSLLDEQCPNCGEPFDEGVLDENVVKSSKKIKKENTGYKLMIFGAILYFVITIINFVYVPDTRDLEDFVNYSRLMTALGFFGVIAFMYGSIRQMAVLMLE